MSKFNAQQSLEELQTILNNYNKTEDVGSYSEETYIYDILFFLGKSIDNKEYNMANGFRKFMARKIADYAAECKKAEFKNNLGMRP